jgi:hypothetical protein
MCDVERAQVDDLRGDVILSGCPNDAGRLPCKGCVVDSGSLGVKISCLSPSFAFHLYLIRIRELQSTLSAIAGISPRWKGSIAFDLTYAMLPVPMKGSYIHLPGEAFTMYEFFADYRLPIRLTRVWLAMRSDISASMLVFPK